MKPPPAGLPPANSRKWHQRRWWDGLGYLRVRSLGNPTWERDTRWLARLLQLERDSVGLGHSADLVDPTDRGLYDQAIAAIRRYPRTASGVDDPDLAWDEVLEPIDEILIHRQENHIQLVRRAQHGEPED